MDLRLRQSFLALVILLLPATKPVFAQQALSLAADGRTLVQPPVVSSGDAIHITIRPSLSQKDRCDSERPEAGDLIVKYRFTPALEQPVVLSVDDRTAIPDKPVAVNTLANAGNPANASETTVVVDRGFQIPASRTSRFLVFNVWEGSADAKELDALRKCVTQLRGNIDSMAPLQKAVADAQAESDQAKQTVTTTQQQISSLTENIKAFAGMASEAAVQRVTAIQATLQEVRARLTTEEAASKRADTRLAAATADLRKAAERNNGTPEQLKSRADRLSDFIAAKGSETQQKPYFEAAVLKLGGMLVGRNVKGVYYDLSDRSAISKVTAVSPMGSYPVVLYGDELFAGLLNVLDTNYPRPFTLSATAQAATVINVAPARPVFEPGKTSAEASAERPSRVTLGDRVYRDVFLPVVGNFAPNTFAEVTIVTQGQGDDGKPAEVKLVDKAKYPPFRALYRFNFSSGVMRTNLRSHTFQKVKIVDDDPATEKVNEARYRVDDLQGDPRVMPIFAFSVYLVPVDIQNQVTWRERLVPAPTIGFAFTNPANDVFVGFSHEVVRNLQFVWGLHFGVVSQAVTRNVVSEDHDATAPVTRDKRDKAFAFGLTFNVNVITKIFH